MTATASCKGTAINGSLSDGLAHGTMCRRAVEDLPECMARHFKIGAVQLDGGDFHCHSDFAGSPGAVLSLERMARSVHLSCAVRDDWVALVIPVNPAGSRFNGEAVKDSRVPLAFPGAKCEWCISSGSDLLVALAERRRLLTAGGKNAVTDRVSRAIGANARPVLLRADPEIVAEARAELLALLGGTRDGRVVDVSSFESEVLAVMLRVIDSAEVEALGSSSAASLVRRAKQLVGDTPKKYNAAALSEKLQVSPRTLSYAFKAVTGASPHAFFLRERLNAARMALLRANPERDLVTSIALELGFTELGRFSTRYRELFGELPSATLARCADESVR